MSWAQERRDNRAADREQARRDADAATERDIAQRAAAAQRRREERSEEQARVELARDKRTATRRARRAALAGFLGRYRVELLVYPLAVVSAVMAVPAMADYGRRIYAGEATGMALPLLSELGMWAFAIAVEVRRRTAPGAPLWPLLAGTATFAGVGFAANFLHGLNTGWSVGVVMGIVSVAGVLAHQLVTAGELRTRAERAAARIDRQAAAKVARVRRAAVRQAVAEIGADGTARLVIAPGRYVLGHRGRLVAAIEVDTAPEPHPPGTPFADRVEADLAAITGPTIATDGTRDHGPVATLDHPAPGTTATDADADVGTGHATADRGTRTTGAQRKSTRKRSTRKSDRPTAGRTIGDLRRELADLTATDPGAVNLGSAESIRKALRCAPAAARQLRDEHTQH